MSDREAVRLALHLAILWEDSLMDANVGDDPAQQKTRINCRQNMADFKRVLRRRYSEAIET